MPPTLDLVFSGGGTRGVALAGAVDVLEQYRPTVKRTIGSSAGAIAATFGAAGFLGRDYLKLVPTKVGDPFLFNAFFAPPPGDKVRDAARLKDSETRRLLRGAVDAASDKFLERVAERRPRIGEMMQGAFALGKQPFYEAAFERFIDNIDAKDTDPKNPKKSTFFFALMEFGGIFDPDLFRAWLVERMQGRLRPFDRTTTLKQFHAAAADVGRELSVVAADITDAKPLVLNHRTAPGCPVTDAVLMSLSVPMVWPENLWKREWGTYLGQDITGHAIVDGSVLANFPLQYLLNREKEEVRAILGDPEKDRPAIIGLLLDGSLAVPGDVAKAGPPPVKLIERINRLFDTMSAWQGDAIRGAEEVICHIGAKGHPALELAQTADTIDRLQALVNSGRCAMTEHLKKRKLF
jgi:NTE family protein